MSAEKLIQAVLQGYEKTRDYAIKDAESTYKINVEALQRKQAELTELYQKLIASEDDDEIEELEEEAADLAEYLEIEFAYERSDGTKRVYSPEAFWEPSGGCEWVESAQYGDDYGWNI